MPKTTLGRIHTSQHESVVQHRLLRQGEQKAEDAADCVETLQWVADGWRDTADGSVRAAVIGYDVRVQINVVYANAVHDPIHLATDALSLVWQQNQSIIYSETNSIGNWEERTTGRLSSEC